MIYLQATSHMQCHFLYNSGRKSFQAALPPLLYQVIEGLLSSVLHGQTLGTIFGSGEGTETLMFAQRRTRFKRANITVSQTA